MNEQLIDKLESKCQLVETLERDLLDARKKVSQRKSSIESGSRKMSLAKSEDELDPKFSQVKNAVMKEPDMEPKTSSEIGINYIVLTYIYRNLAEIILITKPRIYCACIQDQNIQWQI